MLRAAASFVRGLAAGRAGGLSTTARAGPCMDAGVCQKHFPKDFADRTSIKDDSYAEIRRRAPGRTVSMMSESASTADTG